MEDWFEGMDDRLAVLDDYWAEFDEIHARQAPGMKPLWGLVEEGHGVLLGSAQESLTPGLYADLLSPALCEAVENAWGVTVRPHWPERMVTEIAPHARMAEAFGPALTFWHGAALTAWFRCEGLASRTDMAGLAEYHSSALSVLDWLECPVDPGLFAELVDAESRLGPPEWVGTKTVVIEKSPGVRQELTMKSGQRRAGFERLRDILTRHRRSWAQRYLDSYLERKSAVDLGIAAARHAEEIAGRKRPPTAKQFARFLRHAVGPTNLWLGGDLAAFFAAIGEESPLQPVRVSLMPADRRGFAARVFQELGGFPLERDVLVSGEAERLRAQEPDRYLKLRWLGERSLDVVQLEEAIGSPPQLGQFGTTGFSKHCDVLDPDPEIAWSRYLAVVERERRRPIPSDGRHNALPTDSATERNEPLTYKEAYERTARELRQLLSSVTDQNSAQSFVEEAVRKLKAAAADVPEFYIGEFLEKFQTQLKGDAEAELARSQNETEQIAARGKRQTAELNARLDVARADGDEDAVHSIWRESEQTRAENQAAVDALANRLTLGALRLSAVKDVAFALGYQRD